jgi:hypothetical protein
MPSALVVVAVELPAPPTCTCSASLMFGSVSAENSTSTTLPRTCTTLPVALAENALVG